MLSTNEQHRLGIIRSAISRKTTNSEAAKVLGVSERHVKRLKASFRKYGEGTVIHRLKNKVSNNSFPPTFKESVLRIIREKYTDFGPSFASEKLAEEDGLKVNPETLRLWMIKEGLWKFHKKKKPKYFSFRERKEYFGELIQFDGSYHHWFEDRLLDTDKYPIEICLLAGIDDATSQVSAKFDMNEGVFAVFSFWKEYLKKNGKPLNIYLDKYSTYKINHKNAVDNSDLLTQFQKVMKTFDINVILANSPQAKGRVERLFGTLQDRLVKELRLNGISNIESGNKFLEEVFIPKFNKQFSVIPAKGGNVHRSLLTKEIRSLNSIFSVKSIRRINNDYTIRFKNKFYQLKEIQPTTIRSGQKIEIEEWLDKKIKFSFNGKYLKYFVLPKRPEKIKSAPMILTGHKTNWKPPLNHPWRRFNFTSH